MIDEKEVLGNDVEDEKIIFKDKKYWESNLIPRCPKIYEKMCRWSSSQNKHKNLVSERLKKQKWQKNKTTVLDDVGGKNAWGMIGVDEPEGGDELVVQWLRRICQRGEKIETKFESRFGREWRSKASGQREARFIFLCQPP